MDIVKNTVPQPVSALAVDQRVSNWHRLRDRMQALVAIRLSAVSETTGIKFKLKDSFDGGATSYDVGDQSEVSIVKKAFSAGTAEVTDTTWPAFASATQGDYLHVTAQDGTTFAIWLDLDEDGTEPTGALYLAADEQIRVGIATGGTAAQTAAAARAAVLTNEAFVAAFSVSTVTTATFTITQKASGDVANPAPKAEDDDGAGSITVSVTAAGANGDVTLATNQIAESSHGFVSGDRVFVKAGSGSTLPGGLSEACYFVIKVDTDNYKLAATQENALAGVAVDLTDYGTGTATVYMTDYEIRMIKEDASDLAQLPLHGHVAVFVSTGSSDSCTVENIFVPEV